MPREESGCKKVDASPPRVWLRAEDVGWPEEPEATVARGAGATGGAPLLQTEGTERRRDGGLDVQSVEGASGTSVRPAVRPSVGPLTGRLLALNRGPGARTMRGHAAADGQLHRSAPARGAIATSDAAPAWARGALGKR